VPISVEQANRGACDACGRIVWSIDFEPLDGVITLMRVHDDFGGRELLAFSCMVDSAHVALSVSNVMKPYDKDGPPAPQHSDFEPPPSAQIHPEDTFDALSAALLPAVKKSKRPPARTDDSLRKQLKQQLRDWESDGITPSITRIKKILRVGDDRAIRLLNSVTPDSEQ
jgi:hypothetical protein